MTVASNLVRLIYASRATFDSTDPGVVEPQVGRILMQSRSNNPRRAIGGVLHFGDGRFFQCLEGDRDAVNELYNHIARDDRHTDVQILSAGGIENRYFPNWSMKYVPIEDQIKRTLREHGLSQFDPYRFGGGLIDELLAICVASEDPSGRADQDYGDAAPRSTSQPLWKRIIGRR